MYEAGLFTDLKGDDLKKIIYIHSTDKRPKPLKHLQGIKAEIADIEKFLKDLFVKTKLLRLEKPLSPWLEDNMDVLSDRAKKITALLKRESTEKVYFGHHLFINVIETGSLTDKKIPANALVTSERSEIWSLFDLQPGKWPWWELEKEARRNRDQRWLGELTNAMNRAKEGKFVDPIRSTYLSRRDMKNYRPILYRLDKSDKGSMVFKLLFYNDPSWQFVNVPDRTATLVTALIMATRLRHEVLNPYIKKLKKNSTNDSIQDICIEVQKKMDVITEESEIRGLLNEEKLRDVFDEQKEKLEIENYYMQFREFNQKLIEAIQNKQCEDIIEQLKNIKNLVNQFMKMGIRRLQELNKIEEDN